MLARLMCTSVHASCYGKNERTTSITQSSTKCILKARLMRTSVHASCYGKNERTTSITQSSTKVCILKARLKAGTHITAPRPTHQSAVCWPSCGERIAAQFSTCKSTHVRTDTRPSWPHRARTVTDMWSLNFDGHADCTKLYYRPIHVSGTVRLCVSRPVYQCSRVLLREERAYYYCAFGKVFETASFECNTALHSFQIRDSLNGCRYNGFRCLSIVRGMFLYTVCFAATHTGKPGE
ncbi:hypothetical protein J6590_057589 [Homalodisca vitripennis]|nr:hypothetical protein J6590_057589 [Homalodisca vitripennis]